MKYFCEHCRSVFSGNETDAGKKIPCCGCGREILLPESRLDAGSVIAEYRIIRFLAQGDMGNLYLSEHLESGESVALKILSVEHTYDAKFIVSFIHSGRAASKKEFKNTVKVLGVGEDDGLFYYAMEYVEGRSLADILASGEKIPLTKAIEMIRCAGETLEDAWQNGKILHRSIKPDNILVTNDGTIKLADFGLARDFLDLASRTDEDRSRLVQYAPPEVLSDFSMTGMDLRSDIYSLGAVFYHLVTGKTPYYGFSVQEIISGQIPAEPVAPIRLQPELSENLQAVILKMISLYPNERYQNYAEFLEALKTAELEQSPPHSTKRTSRKKEATATVRLGSAKRAKIRPAEEDQDMTINQLDQMQRKREARSQTIVMTILLLLFVLGIVSTLFIRWLVYEPRESAREMEINIARMKERAIRRKSLYQPLQRGAQERLCRGVVALCSNEDFVAAQRYVNDFSRHYPVDPVKKEMLKRHIRNAHVFFGRFSNSGGAAAGIRIVSRQYGPCTILSVRDSVIEAVTDTGKHVEILIRAFSHEEYRSYFRSITAKFGLQAQLCSYLLCTGNFEIALSLVQNADLRREFDWIIYGYIRSGLSHASPLEIRQMRMLYGSLDAFQKATHPEK